MFEAHFNANLSALFDTDPTLADTIKRAALGGSFELIVVNSDYALYNIKDTMRGTLLYENLPDAMQLLLKKLKQKTAYDYLYLYGIGNAYTLPFLLKNSAHKRIVIIEPEAELFFVAMHLIDMSVSLRNGSLVFILEKELTFARAVQLFLFKQAKLYARSFELIPMGAYYEIHYAHSMQWVHERLLEGLSHNITTSGNDITDSLIGVAHHIRHLKEMITAPAFESLKPLKNSNWAVVVSTGPSLYQQLPQLKVLAPYVTIICVDASLPILEQQGISPDIVTSIERVALTAEFFKRTPSSFHRDIIFVCASLEHDETLDAIHGTKILAMRPFDYNRYFELDAYGYVGAGMSAANMAHELAFIMGFDHTILIGQDLAYASDGTSHAAGHVFGAQEINPTSREQFRVTAYGGKGTVSTQLAWKLFLGYFEYAVSIQKGYMTTFNATEGGARIHGTIEKPFGQLAQEILASCHPKKPIIVPNNDPSTQKMLLEHTQTKLAHLTHEGTLLLEAVQEAFLYISSRCKPLEGLNEDEFLHYFDQETIVELLDKIAHVRTMMESNEVYINFFADVMQATMLHLELDMAQIKVRYVHDKTTNRQKAMDWILTHQYWLFHVAGSLHNTLELIKENNPFD